MIITREKSTSSLDFIPGLDGVRALSAFLVITSHWHGNLLSFKSGWIGVNIFFVLSGFLITRVLLHEKEKSFKNYIADFYYNRSLRIFPLYYGFLLGALFLMLVFTKIFPQALSNPLWHRTLNTSLHDMWYYLSYTYNLKINLRYFFHWPDTSNLFFSHLWSLSVEEQFYLVFPLVVYYSPKKVLKILITGLLIFCPLLRLWISAYGVDMVTDTYWLGELIYTNTLCQADALAAGAALAVFNIRISKPYLIFFVVAIFWLVTGLVCTVFLKESAGIYLKAGDFGYDSPWYWLKNHTAYFFVNVRASYLYTLVNLLAVALIAPAIQSRPLFPAFFNHPLVGYLGKISYGIYLFHKPVLGLCIVAGFAFGGWYNLVKNPVGEIITFVIYIIIVAGMAHCSYQFFEKKILALKR